MILFLIFLVNDPLKRRIWFETDNITGQHISTRMFLYCHFSVVWPLFYNKQIYHIISVYFNLVLQPRQPLNVIIGLCKLPTNVIAFQMFYYLLKITKTIWETWKCLLDIHSVYVITLVRPNCDHNKWLLLYLRDITERYTDFDQLNLLKVVWF